MNGLTSCVPIAEGSEHVEGLLNGAEMEVPLWISKRSAELGHDASAWRG